ncbi:hypothetical protein OS493_031688 [Desmophyllum pertusum]|uniref:Uncharacterized protein n=1 Tax=Desmophyllum pertusum TaxID=174260 RepID=A0A9X0D8F6_9CNID|nr:hypothetical protein OS493_031688 [Desmophyllum pertusum]
MEGISMVTIPRFIGNSNCQLLCFCDARLGPPVIEIDILQDPNYKEKKSSGDKLLELWGKVELTQDVEQLKETEEDTSTMLRPTRAAANRARKQTQRLLSNEIGNFFLP